MLSSNLNFISKSYIWDFLRLYVVFIPFCVDMNTRLENDKIEEMMMRCDFSGISVLQQKSEQLCPIRKLSNSEAMWQLKWAHFTSRFYTLAFYLTLEENGILLNFPLLIQVEVQEQSTWVDVIPFKSFIYLFIFENEVSPYLQWIEE